MKEESPIVDLDAVTVRVDGSNILGPLNWKVERGQHWAVLGPNGSGKSTLIQVASLALHPSVGTVRVLGHELGRVDVRSLRSRIGISSASLVDQLRASLTCREVVACGLTGALEPWWHAYSDDDNARAEAKLGDVGLAGYGSRRLGTLSSGERQRALLARALVADPDLVILDEPTAGLDFGGRESLIEVLESMARSPEGPASVFVTHHVEDIPSSTSHLIGLTDGRVSANGPIASQLTSKLLSEMFDLEVDLATDRGRWTARVVKS